MKKFLVLLLLITFFSCSDDETETIEQSANCLEIAFLESTVIEPNDCLTFSDKPDFEFTFLGFENYTKSHPNNVPHAGISGRLVEGSSTFEFYNGQISEDYETEGTSFSGRVHTGINNVDYTIFFDNIEFTETETEFIFNKATIRFGYYDSEFE
ncbi:hypothetical protein [Lacinutrix sp. MedPE-SW]|uniref:hypothetical protein n=1 Tax=Lacinutrix sp. MedPE-SW TaxID=1860087 RepID=UPI000911ABA8|nr:hypothetical protein [Lacinutrix sp. MedPE-SW]OIQ23058.1 MAG: hypothetical protein BM549_05925 [Lacinutrix sp. MedPE-SW]